MIKYIMNMDKIKELCVYDVDTGKYDFKYNGDKLVKPNLGFFARVRDAVYGVTESQKGPVFFSNNKFYNLSEVNYEFEHENLDDKTGRFKLLIDNNVEIDVVYDKPKFTDFDPWNTEEDVDFFQWICQDQKSKSDKERFHQFYTRN
ncbi:hypothetical protein C8E03_1362 [Lachnotalea glycerini]|uniref:WG repeat-containing protein n=1 Tax=Lachnotalea glycerini TaxID=1763509 RepID=A0A318EFZ2_9FIRM|nr:hypothetical protein [Lachnotalea glycerini]PXV84109.1 hypothetical protein C8E03_1362 [Lachnotalea glycerini]